MQELIRAPRIFQVGLIVFLASSTRKWTSISWSAVLAISVKPLRGLCVLTLQVKKKGTVYSRSVVVKKEQILLRLLLELRVILVFYPRTYHLLLLLLVRQSSVANDTHPVVARFSPSVFVIRKMLIEGNEGSFPWCEYLSMQEYPYNLDITTLRWQATMPEAIRPSRAQLPPTSSLCSSLRFLLYEANMVGVRYVEAC